MSHSLHPSAHAERPRWYWWFVILGSPVVLVLGAMGAHRYDVEYGPELGVHADWANSFYTAAQMFLLHAPHYHHGVNWMLQVGRWGAASVTLVATGLALAHIFSLEWHALRGRFRRGHVVICSLNRRAREMVRDCREENRRRAVLVLDRAPDPELRATVLAAGASVLQGDVTDPDFLRRIALERAACLIAAATDDRVNIEVAVRAHNLVQAAPRWPGPPLECFVQISDLDLRVSFQRNQILQETGGRIRVHFFDLYENVARRLLLETLPLDQGGIGETDPRQPHLIILGFGQMGSTVLLKAAQVGHFANRRRLRVTVLDRHAARHEEALLFRHPQIRSVCGVEFVQVEAESAAARTRLETCFADRSQAVSVAVCFDNDRLALDVALRLFTSLQQHRIPIAVRMASRTGLATLLNAAPTRAEVRFLIRTFGDFDDEHCARAYRTAAHDAMARAIQERFIAKGRSEGRDPQTDPAMREWPELPEDFRDSNRQQADHLPLKIRAIDCELAPLDDPRPAASFTPEEINLLAEMEHSRWVAERLLAGWRYAPGRKDVARRTNPNLVPWHDLDDPTKDYDRDTVRNIPAIVALLQRKVCRRAPLGPDARR